MISRRLVRAAARRLAPLALLLVGGIYRLARRRSSADPVAPRRILVIRLDLLGDVLLSMPAVAALRAAYPAAWITMLTLPYTAPLARLYDCVDEVVEVDTNRIRSVRGLLQPATWRAYRQVQRLLRQRDFDLAVSLCGQMASLWAFLSGAPRTVGYLEEAYPGLLTDLVPGGRHVKRQHEVEYTWRLARAAGARVPPERPFLLVPEGARQRVARLLQENGIRDDDRLALVHAGSINGSAKRWPAAHWGEFITQLWREDTVKIVLIGAASDEPISREVQRAADAPLVSLVGETGIEELIALIARADLVATGDSGPLHLAAALGRPLLAVYGPTDLAVYGPYRPRAPVRLHRRDLPCSPCYTMAASAECPLGDPICMRLIRPREMVASARQLLGS